MKILVPLDGSKFSEAIIDPAGNLAASSGAEVHLISVVKVSDVHSSCYELPGRGTFR
ncbi:MAG: universal stress protein [Chloroflexi bacterium]|nr:universal stress protein [Chloroflexota bacterium]